MPVSDWDDFPVHQAPEFIRHPATSDRNFYDRYYFNMHPCAADWYAIFGFGQYPNLGVVDAFIDVRKGPRQHIVRASKPLADRADLSVGPVPDRGARAPRAPPVRRRADRAPGRHGRDLGGPHPGHRRAPPVHPRQGTGDLRHPAPGPDRDRGRGPWWSGARRSPSPRTAAGATGTGPGGSARWASPSPTGIREGEMVLPGMWNYFPMQFDDHAIFVHLPRDRRRASARWSRPSGCGPTPTGPSTSWAERAPAPLEPGTRVIDRLGASRSPRPGSRSRAPSILPNFVSVGTGYGIDADWRHGMYHGPDPVVQGLVLEVDRDQGHRPVRDRRPPGPVQLRRPRRVRPLRQGFFGPFRRYGMTDGYGGPGRGSGGRGPADQCRRPAHLAGNRPGRSAASRRRPRGRPRRCEDGPCPTRRPSWPSACRPPSTTVEPGADPVLRASDRADFQANGALALAKRLGRDPRRGGRGGGRRRRPRRRLRARSRSAGPASST